ncbi:hypothetical protein ACF1AO_29860 [Streptomyces longwoodensis]|uniref:hypothetical protein n=1 Tax=Streptomyces longwoodensis TaxID=68231 RepID=UPI0036F84316
MIAESYIGSNDMWDTIIGALVAVVVGILAVWATLYVAKPRRRLLWVPVSNVPLLRGGSIGSDVSVKSGGSDLAKPRIVTLALKNAGRRDILAQDFASDDESLQFDFGAKIVKVLQATVEPSTAPEPDMDGTGSVLSVRRSLIKSQQAIRISVLVDGDEEGIVCLRAHLIETPIKHTKHPEGIYPLWRRDAWLAVALSLMAALIVSAISVLVTAIVLQGHTYEPKYVSCKIDRTVTFGLMDKESCAWLKMHYPRSEISPAPKTENPLSPK